MFDYTIIGAGPTGITLAFYLSQLNKKVLLVDRGSQIGGIHAVKRVNGLYTKHSPTIYVYSFYMFQKLLKDMNISYNEIFTPYNFGPINFVLKSIEYFRAFPGSFLSRLTSILLVLCLSISTFNFLEWNPFLKAFRA